MSSLKWFFTLALIVVLAIINLPQTNAVCPVICPALYSPVCAEISDGAKVSYANQCSAEAAACARQLTVVSTTPGEC
uniref:Putative vasotab-like protein n=1 Tax=Haematobia irritans TaxID=7368 RepID=A0A1L8ECM9_HAEIR